ncbi:glycosyltransferase family 2 protein [Sphingomonas lycopersici]|uniref:Glycosyltransferase n=1 Tax=Sphingomonas lycopersici TaxID=2951807 RepID=A0AA41ZCR4_9SPHN|nr:glycosyltransferase family 2 protein [Sphingomonas lycopersici]MCW6537284.1 glycosyltransferase [Sphingomonas lycopersici]
MSAENSLVVSLVTAAFNRERTIGQAVESVRHQTYPAIEHIIIDGGSRDNTVRIARAAARKGAIISSEPDDGIYDAFNKGVKRASGDVIGFVHSDDFLAADDVIAKVVNAFADPKVDAVYGDLDYVLADDPSRVLRRWRSGAFERRKLGRGWMPPHPALFLRRRIYERYGYFDTEFDIAADYEFILRIFSQPQFTASYINETFVKMRIGGVSNKSLKNIVKKTSEDLRSLKRHNIGGIYALFIKNLSKTGQFINLRK